MQPDASELSAPALANSNQSVTLAQFQKALQLIVLPEVA
jgi:hypothetical protein